MDDNKIVLWNLFQSTKFLVEYRKDLQNIYLRSGADECEFLTFGEKWNL